MNSKHFIRTFTFLILTSIVFISSSCKKDTIFSKGNLTFSVDTLVFDTVFTTLGSTTKNFKFYNGNNQVLNIEEIELMGGSNSPFRLNIDGISGFLHKDVEVLGKDSLYAFVDVKLNVNGQNLPMIIEDSIRFKSNGKNQFVKLAVWGQDAYFHYNDWNQGVWPNDKPHVVYGRTYVDSNKVLTIQEGTKIHLHKNSIFFVYKSTLKVNGTKDNKVIFQGDRLESFYKNTPGQWYGIYFNEAFNSEINHAIIKNGTAGIQMYGNSNVTQNPSLTIRNTEIYNNGNYGIFLYDGNNIRVENTIIYKNGSHAFLAVGKNKFELIHCNLLGYGNGNTSSPAVAIKNYYEDQTSQYISDIDGKIYNSVIYGNLQKEFIFDTINPNQMVNLNFDFKNMLIKYDPLSNNPFFSNIIWNNNPMFQDLSNYNFKFNTNSPLNNNGLNSISLPFDLFENPRNNPPDIGAIELQ